MCYARRRSMSEERAEKFLELFNKGKEFTEELLRENQRLRYRVAALETEHGDVSSEEVQRLRAEIQQLTEENRQIQQRFGEVEEENKDFANRYIEIEEQNNNLANLYVASYQLHYTLDFKEVIQIVQEIVINLIGAEAFAILLDRGAEQQPGQSLRGQLPAPLHARLQGSHPDRAGDRHQSHRRRGLRHPAARREDERPARHRLRRRRCRGRHRKPLGPPRRGHSRRRGQDRRELLHQSGRRRRPRDAGEAAGGGAAQDQGARD